MKKAKEIAEDSKFISSDFTQFEFTPDVFKQFCEQLLEEQRESCAYEYGKIEGVNPVFKIKEFIRNASKPNGF